MLVFHLTVAIRRFKCCISRTRQSTSVLKVGMPYALVEVTTTFINKIRT